MKFEYAVKNGFVKFLSILLGKFALGREFAVYTCLHSAYLTLYPVKGACGYLVVKSDIKSGDYSFTFLYG